MVEVTIGYSVLAFVSYFFTLREKCLYLEFFRSVFPAFGRNAESISPYSVRIGENADQKNSEYGHCSRYVNCAVVVSV